MLDRSDGSNDTRETLTLDRQLKPTAFFLVRKAEQRRLWLRWAGLPPKGDPKQFREITFTQSDSKQLETIVGNSDTRYLLPLLRFARAKNWNEGVPRRSEGTIGYFHLLVRSIACAHVAYPIVMGYRDGKLEAIEIVAYCFRGSAPAEKLAYNLAVLTSNGMAACGTLLTHSFFKSCSDAEQTQLLIVYGEILSAMVNLARQYHNAVAAIQVSAMVNLARQYHNAVAAIQVP